MPRCRVQTMQVDDVELASSFPQHLFQRPKVRLVEELDTSITQGLRRPARKCEAFGWDKGNLAAHLLNRSHMRKSGIGTSVLMRCGRCLIYEKHTEPAMAILLYIGLHTTQCMLF